MTATLKGHPPEAWGVRVLRIAKEDLTIPGIVSVLNDHAERLEKIEERLCLLEELLSLPRRKRQQHLEQRKGELGL